MPSIRSCRILGPRRRAFHRYSHPGLFALAEEVTLLGDMPADFIDGSGFCNIVALLTLAYNKVLNAACATTGGNHQFRLSVVRTDGSRVGTGRALVRSILSGLSATFLGLGYLMDAFRKDKRALHDMFLYAKVVRRRGTAS